MIWILADTRSDAERIRRAVGGAAHVIETANELEANEGRINCLVVGCRSQVLPEKVGLLMEIEWKVPWVPLILVTDREASSARLLSNVRISTVVWFDKLQTQLQLRIEAALGTTALAHLAEKIRGSSMPPALRRALVHSLRQAGHSPVRNVTELASAVRRSQVTLSRAFSAQVDGATTLSRFLGGLVILRAQQLRLSGASWKEVSYRLGFDRGTLNRKSRRWLRHSLSELERVAPDRLLSAFVEQYVRPLLDEIVPPSTDATATDRSPLTGA